MKKIPAAGDATLIQADDDITMSRDFVADPAVAAILRSYDQREREARFKGFNEPLAICQITPC
jgi:hypothetical protein